MPAMTKEQYHARGAADSAAGNPPAALRAGTWQKAAYNKGFAGIPLDGTEGPRNHTPPRPAGRGMVPPPDPAHRTPAPAVRQVQYGVRPYGKSIVAAALSLNVQKWPTAAREHALRLMEDLQQEKSPRRGLRLTMALHRMNKKHGARAQAAADFPLSTVPHPDGPVTVKQVLAGR